MDILKRYLELIALLAIGILFLVAGGVTPDEVNIYEEIGKAVITGAVISYFAFMFRQGKEASALSKEQKRLSELLDKLDEKVNHQQ